MNRFGNSINDIYKEYWKKIHHPFRGGIELTSMCNMECSHCYLNGFRDKEQLSTNEIFLILDKLYNSGVLFIYFTGGEVFCRNDFLEIYVYAKKKGFLITILTNATLIDDNVINIFNKYPPFLVSISIYGCSEEVYDKVTNTHGNYEKFSNALNLLHNNNIQFELKFIILKENYQHYDLGVALAKKYNVGFSHAMEMFPALTGSTIPIDDFMLDNRDIVKFEAKHKELSKVWKDNINITTKYSKSETVPLFVCSIDCGNFLIDKDGFLYPCNKMRFEKNNNILECDLLDVYPSYQKYKRIEASKNFKCKKCKYVSICNPCPAINKLATGDFEKPYEKLCELIQFRFEAFS